MKKAVTLSLGLLTLTLSLLWWSSPPAKAQGGCDWVLVSPQSAQNNFLSDMSAAIDGNVGTTWAQPSSEGWTVDTTYNFSTTQQLCGLRADFTGQLRLANLFVGGVDMSMTPTTYTDLAELSWGCTSGDTVNLELRDMSASGVNLDEMQFCVYSAYVPTPTPNYMATVAARPTPDIITGTFESTGRDWAIERGDFMLMQIGIGAIMIVGNGGILFFTLSLAKRGRPTA